MACAAAASSWKVDRTRSGPLRSKASSDVTCAQPSPTSPSTRSSGTNTPSRCTSLKWWSPPIEMIGRIVTPGARRSTMNWLRPVVPVGRVERRGAGEREERVGLVRAGGPHLGAGEPPAAVDPLGAGADAREVGARVGLAHPDAEDDLAAADPGQERLLLLLGAVAQQRRADLALGDPVGRDGRTDDEQLLGDDEALEVGAALAAVLGRDDHAEPAAPAELTGELAVPPGQPRVDVRHERPRRDLLGEEGPHLEAQLGQRGQLPGTREGRDGPTCSPSSRDVAAVRAPLSHTLPDVPRGRMPSAVVRARW